jgi:sulfur carrier protein
MKLELNGEWQETQATTLAELLAQMDYGDAPVATARNGQFIRKQDRAATKLQPEDKIEILVPRQGG